MVYQFQLSAQVYLAFKVALHAVVYVFPTLPNNVFNWALVASFAFHVSNSLVFRIAYKFDCLIPTGATIAAVVALCAGGTGVSLWFNGVHL